MRLRILLPTIIAALALLVGSFYLNAEAQSQKRGHLIITVNGNTQVLPPGQAKQLAEDSCPGDTLDIHEVRALFPGILELCSGVEIRSQIGGATSPTTTTTLPTSSVPPEAH